MKMCCFSLVLELYIFFIPLCGKKMQLRLFENKMSNRIETHILCSVTIFPENRAFYEILSKIVEEPERPQMTI
jgi:hypothetical protein